MALMAVIMGLGPLFYILLGFRYWSGLRFSGLRRVEGLELRVEDVESRVEDRTLAS